MRRNDEKSNKNGGKKPDDSSFEFAYLQKNKSQNKNNTDKKR